MTTRPPHKTGLMRLWRAFGYSFKGLKAAWHNEAAFRQELLLVLVLLPAAFWLGENAVQRALLICALLQILIVELLNSAVEAVVDRIGLENHPLAGQAKDMGSATVLLSLILAAIVWGLMVCERWCFK